MTTDHIVYGNHDDRTLNQMKTCMEAGSAAAQRIKDAGL